MISINRKNPTAGEITSSLTNASDGQGLHFDGSSGNIDIASPPDLGTKFSFEFIVQADSWADSAYKNLVDFGNGGRFIFGTDVAAGAKLAIYDGSAFNSFGVDTIEDLKVHHLIVTIDGTAAILYDNGNLAGTAEIGTGHVIDGCADARIGSSYTGGSGWFNGTIYRARFFNRTLTAAEVTATYENATVPFADQYGSQTKIIDSDFTGNLDGWDDYNSWNSQTNPSNNMVLAASAPSQSCRTSHQLTGGKQYRVTYTATSTAGSPAFAYYSNTAVVEHSGSSTLVDGTNSFEFTQPTGLTYGYFYVLSLTTDAAVTLDDISVVEIGCVADYDCAFSNPEISTLVQDRAGAADGTSSASGVTQVTPIEQVNTNKLSVGGTTPRVGIGLAAGSTPTVPLDIKADASNGGIRLEEDAGGGSNTVATISQRQSAGSRGGKLVLSDEGVAKVTLEAIGDSSFMGGNVGVGGTPVGKLSIIGGTATSESSHLTFENTAGAKVFAVGGGKSGVSNNGFCVVNVTDDTAPLTISDAGLCSFSNGIAFSSQTDTSATGAAATSTTLDHYEEGTWTPLLAGDSATKTVAAGNFGSYTRIGDLVTVMGTVKWDGTETIGNMPRIAGLPFTANATTNYRSAGSVGGAVGITLSTGMVDLRVTCDTGRADCFIVEANLTTYAHTSGMIGNTGTIYGFTLTYKV